MQAITSKEEYQALVDSGKPMLLDFYADWCGPCQVMLPVIDRLADEHKDDFAIAKVNVDHNRALAQEFGVRSIPALFFLKDGEVVERLTGVQSAASLEEKIQSYK